MKMAQSEALDKCDDLRTAIMDLESDKLEALKMQKGSSSSKAVKMSGKLNKQSANYIIDLFYEYNALTDNVKIGKHPKTTGIEKEGLASMLTELFETADKGTNDFKAFNSAIIIPS